MIKNWCIYILALAGTFTFFLFYQMWMAWYCLVLLLCIPPLSLIMCLLSVRKRKVRLIAPRNVKIGDEVSVDLTIPETFANMISFLRVDYSFTEKMIGERIRRKMYIHGNTNVSIPVYSDHCGAFEVEVTRIKIYDLFGLFWTRQKPRCSCEVIIHPVPQIPDAMPDLNGFKARTLKKSIRRSMTSASIFPATLLKISTGRHRRREMIFWSKSRRRKVSAMPVSFWSLKGIEISLTVKWVNWCLPQSIF